MQNILNEFFSTKEGKELLNILDKEYENNIVYPAKEDVFKAFKLCNTPNVVIIGQDPYHDGSADGLAFSSSKKTPPSLKNIFKEIYNDFGVLRTNSNLEDLAKQGVLLLNASLSVKAKTPNSHKYIWEDFFAFIIKRLNENYSNLVFMLWGNFAIKSSEFINNEKHLVLCAAHPSPLARGKFFGCSHFKKCNEYLKGINKNEIIWA